MEGVGSFFANTDPVSMSYATPFFGIPFLRDSTAKRLPTPSIAKCVAHHNKTMTENRVQINRTLVGILALICLITAAVIFFVRGHEESWQMWQAAFTRVGLVMSAIWIALPTRDRPAAWANVSGSTFIGILLVVLAAALPRFRILLPILIVAGIVTVLFRPREKKRPQA